MDSFTIKDIENLTGIKAHTIRIWEQRYSFIKPQRSNTNIRYYTNEDLRTILNIALLNKHGYKISHINNMSDSEKNDKILELNQAEAIQDRIINDMIKCMIDLDTVTFELIVDNYIITKGIEKCIINIIFPFLEKIGLLWSTSHINPAQEHIFSNIIRQKIIVGIENTNSFLKSKLSVLMFLPESEHHEIGLLFMHYILKSRGIEVTYLGSNIPLKDVQFVANYKKPHLLYTHLTCLTASFNITKYLQRLRTAIPQISILISGRLIQHYQNDNNQHLHFAKDFQETVSFITSLQPANL